MSYMSQKKIRTIPNILRRSNSSVVNKMNVNTNAAIDTITSRSVGRSVGQFDSTADKVVAKKIVGKTAQRHVRRRKQKLCCRDLSEEENWHLNICTVKMPLDAEPDEENSQTSMISFKNKDNDYQVPVMSQLSSGYSSPWELWYSDDDIWFDAQNVVEVELQEGVEIELQEVVEIEPQEVVETRVQEVVEIEPQEVVEIEPQEVVEIEPQEVVEIEPQEVVEIEPQEVVEIEPQEVVETEVQEVVEIVPQEVLEIEPQEVVEIEPQEVIEIFPDVCLVERVDKFPLNVNDVIRIEQKDLIAVSNSAERDSRTDDESIRDVKWYNCSSCNKRYAHRNSVYRHRKKMHDFNDTTIEIPEISVTSDLSFNNNCLSKTATEKKQLAPASSFAEKENRNLQKNDESARNLLTYYCWICDKGYIHKSSLHYHQKKVHNFNAHAVDPLEIFTCLWCSMQFYNSDSYKKHLKTHSNLID